MLNFPALQQTTISATNRKKEMKLMALITCNECGKEISSRAKTCPQCGLPLKFEAGCGTYLLIFLFGIVFLYSSCKEMIKSQYNILWEERFIKQRQKLLKQLSVFRCREQSVRLIYNFLSGFKTNSNSWFCSAGTSREIPLSATGFVNPSLDLYYKSLP